MAIVTATFPFETETPQEIDFGPIYGLASIYLRSRTANYATTGFLRLANADSIAWRNAGNTANILLGSGSVDAVPAYGGIDLVNLSSAQTLSNKTLVAPIITGSTTFVDLSTSGNTILGDATSDTITFTGRVNSNLLPNATNTYALGGSSNRWSTVYGVNADFTGTLTATNLSGINTGDQTITLTGESTGSGTGSFAVTLNNASVIGKVLTGFSAGAGTVGATDTILQAFNKLAGNLTGTASGTNTGDVTLGAFGSAPDAKGATISGQVITLQPADGTHPGLLTTGTQTIAGAKTFSNTITASDNILAGIGSLQIGTSASNNTRFSVFAFGINNTSTLTQLGILNVSSDGVNLSLSSDSSGYVTVGMATAGRIGFYGVTPTVRPSAYTVSNSTPSRSIDVSTVTLTQLANFVASIIVDQKANGLFQ